MVNSNESPSQILGLGAVANEHVISPTARTENGFESNGYNNMLQTLNTNINTTPTPAPPVHRATSGGLKKMAKENLATLDVATINQKFAESRQIYAHRDELIKADLNKLFPSTLIADNSTGNGNLNSALSIESNPFVVSASTTPSTMTPSTGLSQNLWTPASAAFSPTPWASIQEPWAKYSAPAVDITTDAPPNNFNSLNHAIEALAAQSAIPYITGPPVPAFGSVNTNSNLANRSGSAAPSNAYNSIMAPPPTPVTTQLPGLGQPRPNTSFGHAPVDSGPILNATSRNSGRFGSLPRTWDQMIPQPSPVLTSSFPPGQNWPLSIATPTTPYTPYSANSLTSSQYAQYSGYTDWDAIVDQILLKSDQQCSMNMQNKIKSGDVQDLGCITDAVECRAIPLMKNRTGNFLVQRLFEHAPPDMVVRLASTLLGHVVELSLDQYACHVVQKAFEQVSEEFKRMYIDELLLHVSATMNNKHAAHVWQKLLELRWKTTPPALMPYVNHALQGQWHIIANGEVGSLVVQNVFENCVEEDKRPCINEVLANIEQVAKGQYGNWCIQHIIEHGATPDREFVYKYIINHATDWSMDQYASKCIEKGLKCGDDCEFTDQYLDIICEPECGRSRVPLIDISGDQFGNYLIQWILCNCSDQVRNRIAGHVRKHMVSLRGSKFGSRVAIACTNYHSQTRPGPATGISPLRGVGFGRNGPGEGPRGGPFGQNEAR